MKLQLQQTQDPPPSKQSKRYILDHLDNFTRGYLAAALWAENDNSDESGGSPLDSNYSEEDIAKDDLKAMVFDCKLFQDKAAALLKQAYELYEVDPSQGTAEDYAGHDFWLTRNHHGVGFWDRGFPDSLGDGLSDIARSFSDCNLYVEKGKIYIM